MRPIVGPDGHWLQARSRGACWAAGPGEKPGRGEVSHRSVSYLELIVLMQVGDAAEVAEGVAIGTAAEAVEAAAEEVGLTPCPVTCGG